MRCLTQALSTALFMATLSAPAFAAENIWKINPAGSSINFSLKNMGAAVSGHFNSFTGEVSYDGSHLDGAYVKTTVEVTSIDTGTEPRDHHLRGKDFFNVLEYPQATFESSKVEAQPDGFFVVIGKLSLHGVAEEVRLNAKPLQKCADKEGHVHFRTEATTDLKRKDFKIGGFAAATISNPVMVKLVIDLTQ